MRPRYLIGVVLLATFRRLLAPGDAADLRDRPEAQAELLRSREGLATAEQRFRSLVEHLPLVTYVDSLDELSSNLYTSPQIEPLLGYPVEQWTSDPGLFVRCLHPEDRERVLAERAVAGELAPWPLLQKPFDVGALADTIRGVLDDDASAGSADPLPSTQP